MYVYICIHVYIMKYTENDGEIHCTLETHICRPQECFAGAQILELKLTYIALLFFHVVSTMSSGRDHTFGSCGSLQEKGNGGGVASSRRQPRRYRVDMRTSHAGYVLMIAEWAMIVMVHNPDYVIQGA